MYIIVYILFLSSVVNDIIYMYKNSNMLHVSHHIINSCQILNEYTALVAHVHCNMDTIDLVHIIAYRYNTCACEVILNKINGIGNMQNAYHYEIECYMKRR